jgi:nicotinate dehydrogenase subunit B
MGMIGKENGGVSSQLAHLSRREFLGLAGGLVITFAFGRELEAGARGGREAGAAEDLNAWLRISPDSRVTVFTGKVEVGQGVGTSLAQMVAEELGVPFSSVEMVMGETDRVPYDGGTYGSLTTRTMGITLRAAAAKAREILAQMAAEQWSVKPADVVVRDGRIFLSKNRGVSVSLGELTQGKQITRALAEEPSLRPVEEYQIVGKSIPRADGRDLVTGAAKFTADVRLPNMAYGAVLHPPSFGARLTRLQAAEAEKLSGVVAVVHEGDFVGLVAERPDIAQRAIALLQADWEETAQPSMAALYDDFRKSASLDDTAVDEGAVTTALAGAHRTFAATYHTSFVAHAPIEPHGSLVLVQNGEATVYPATQCPFRHRDAVAEALNLPPERVHVAMPAVGAGFGGKHQGDTSVQAARLSRAVKRPVLVSQTRAEELTWNYFKPAALIEIRTGVDEAGQVQTWDCDIYNPGARGAVPPYDFANRRVRCYGCDSPLREGSWRGLAGSANTFAIEGHMDYMARELGQDPVEFRLRHLEGDPRLAATIKAAADRYGWRRQTGPTGSGVGFACAIDAGSRVAEIAEVEVDRATGGVRVKRVVAAHESGLVINPDGIQNQIEGAIVMGTGPALTEAVRYEQGKILTNSFATYRIPTFRTAPAIEVVLVPNPTHPPQGAGEPPIFPISAAIAAAIFDATGKRLREMPMTPDRVLAALHT